MPGDSLGPGEGNTVFPNTDAYQGGYVFESGVRINVLFQEGDTITFGVEGMTADTGSDPNDMKPTAAPTVQMEDASNRNVLPPGTVSKDAANQALTVIGVLILLSFFLWLIPFGLAYYRKKQEEQEAKNASAAAAMLSNDHGSVTKDGNNTFIKEEGGINKDIHVDLNNEDGEDWEDGSDGDWKDGSDEDWSDGSSGKKEDDESWPDP